MLICGALEVLGPETKIAVYETTRHRYFLCQVLHRCNFHGLRVPNIPFWVTAQQTRGLTSCPQSVHMLLRKN